MRKSLTFVLLLLLLCAGLFHAAASWLNADKEAVNIREITLAGDITATEGLEVYCHAHSGYHLFWDSVYSGGHQPSLSTEFHFSEEQKTEYSSHRYHGLYFDFYGIYDYFLLEDVETTQQFGISRPLYDVANRSPSGQQYTELVYISAYYKYYPIYVQFDYPGYFPQNDQEQIAANQVFSSFFQIPVLPTSQLEITIDKNEQDEVTGIGMSGVGSDLTVYSIITDDGICFTFNHQASTGEVFDTSLIPGGYGLYYLPMQLENGVVKPIYNALSMVYAIDTQQATVIGLYTNLEKSQILLVTFENQCFMLTILDAASMQEVQKLELLPGDTASDSFNLFLYEDFLVALIAQREFAVLRYNMADGYELAMRSSLPEIEGQLPYLNNDETTMDFDGEKLAIAWYQSYDGCSFYIAVFDASGLLYTGHYQHSLDVNSLLYHRYDRTRVNPLLVQWKP